MSSTSLGPQVSLFFLVHFHLLKIISYLYSNDDGTAEGQRKGKPMTSTHHHRCEPLLTRWMVGAQQQTNNGGKTTGSTIQDTDDTDFKSNGRGTTDNDRSWEMTKRKTRG